MGRHRRGVYSPPYLWVNPALRRLQALAGCLYIALVGSSSSATAAAGRLRAALELYETGVAMMRQNLRRRHPQAGTKEIDERLEAWLLERPGAPSGDCPGRIVDLRTRRT